MDKVRERRRAHGLDDNVCLLLNPQQQSQQQNWIEFQDYHLKLHELQKKKLDGLQKDLNNALKEVGDTDMKGSEQAAQQEEAIHQSLEYAERTLRWHEVILCWIEQRRLAMNPLPPTSVEKCCGDQHALFNRQRRSRRRDTPAVLGKVRVSKTTPKRQNIRTRTSKAITSKPDSKKSTVAISSRTQKQMPERQGIIPRRVKKKVFSQFLSQKVVKANRFANTGTKSRSKTQGSDNGQVRDRARPQHRLITQRPQSTSKTIKSGSQRISKKISDMSSRVKGGICPSTP